MNVFPFLFIKYTNRYIFFYLNQIIVSSFVKKIYKYIITTTTTNKKQIGNPSLYICYIRYVRLRMLFN